MGAERKAQQLEWTNGSALLLQGWPIYILLHFNQSSSKALLHESDE
jgi:hypothetical protein